MATSTKASTTIFADNVSTYEAALKSLFSGKPEDTETDLTKLFTPDFTQRDDDGTRDFPAFVAHIRWLREILPPQAVNLTVTQFLRDGAQLADRHSSSTTKPGGSIGRAETFMFGEVAEDGRISWLVETVVRKNAEQDSQ